MPEVNVVLHDKRTFRAVLGMDAVDLGFFSCAPDRKVP